MRDLEVQVTDRRLRGRFGALQRYAAIRPDTEPCTIMLRTYQDLSAAAGTRYPVAPAGALTGWRTIDICPLRSTWRYNPALRGTPPCQTNLFAAAGEAFCK